MPDNAPDPFDVLRIPEGPVEPGAAFRQHLRTRIVAALVAEVPNIRIATEIRQPRGATMPNTMPARPSWLYYFTLPTKDLVKAKRFYGELFNWVMADNADGTGAHVDGVQPPMGISAVSGDHPRLWFVVDDLDAAVARVRAAGGTAETPVTYESGPSADCRDDQGMNFSLSIPGYPSEPVASSRHGELFYFNLAVLDDDRGKRFFSQVFGWEFGDYTGVHVLNTKPDGGLGGLSKGVHPEVWFRVDDLDAAMEHVRTLGGTAEFAGEGDEGRHALCTDDQGITFGISQPSASY